MLRRKSSRYGGDIVQSLNNKMPIKWGLCMCKPKGYLSSRSGPESSPADAPRTGRPAGLSFQCVEYMNVDRIGKGAMQARKLHRLDRIPLGIRERQKQIVTAGGRRRVDRPFLVRGYPRGKSMQGGFSKRAVQGRKRNEAQKKKSKRKTPEQKQKQTSICDPKTSSFPPNSQSPSVFV